MAKPRRRNPRLAIAMVSPQGRDFVESCRSVVGQDDPAYQAIESFRDGTHLFVLPGPLGLGLLVERPRRLKGEEWVYESGFLAERPAEGVAVQIEFEAHRWDASLAGKDGGSDATLKETAARRRALARQRAEESGRRQDTLTLRILPVGRTPATVAQFDRDAIDKALAKHGLVLGSPAETPGAPEPSASGGRPAAGGQTVGGETHPSRDMPQPAMQPAAADSGPDTGSRNSPLSLAEIYLGPAFPVPETIHTSSMTYLGKERAAGPKASRYLSFLEQEGFRAGFDDDGDVWFEFDGGNYYLLSEEDDPPYFRLLYPNFWPITDEITRQLAHEAVSQVNQEVKGVKLIVGDDQVSAELELFLEPLDTFTRVFPRCLVAVRSAVVRFREIVSPE